MDGDYLNILRTHINLINWRDYKIMNTKVLLDIFTDEMHENKIVDVILKAWVGGLLIMWAVGMVAIISHIIMNPSAVDNATFGIFDTLGN
jgi:hypothetical protein